MIPSRNDATSRPIPTTYYRSPITDYRLPIVSFTRPWVISDISCRQVCLNLHWRRIWPCLHFIFWELCKPGSNTYGLPTYEFAIDSIIQLKLKQLLGSYIHCFYDFNQIWLPKDRRCKSDISPFRRRGNAYNLSWKVLTGGENRGCRNPL